MRRGTDRRRWRWRWTDRWRWRWRPGRRPPPADAPDRCRCQQGSQGRGRIRWDRKRARARAHLKHVCTQARARAGTAHYLNPGARQRHLSRIHPVHFSLCARRFLIPRPVALRRRGRGARAAYARSQFGWESSRFGQGALTLVGEALLKSIVTEAFLLCSNQFPQDEFQMSGVSPQFSPAPGPCLGSGFGHRNDCSYTGSGAGI